MWESAKTTTLPLSNTQMPIITIQQQETSLQVSEIPFGELDIQGELDAIEAANKVKPTKRLMVCVVSSNPRTASVFYSNLFGRIGGGNFDYHVVTLASKCTSAAMYNPLVPTIRMLYQKNLRMEDLKRTLARNSVVIVMGDEFCRCQQEYCSNPALVFARQYFSTAYEDSLYIPLGPRSEFPLLGDEDTYPFASKRKYKFNLIVSPTSAVRRTLYANLVAANTPEDTFLYMTPAFQKNASEPNSGYVSPEEYRSVLLDSKFTLCPAGHNPEAFRIFEAIEAGSIPVLVNGDEEYIQHECADSFLSMLDSGAPFIVLKTWSELDGAIQSLLDDADKLDKLQSDVQQWYSEYWKEITHRFECKFIKHSPMLDFANSGYFYPTDCNLPPPPLELVAARPKSVPLVTGCGRTGTLSLSDYIRTELGMRSLHEKFETNAVLVSWLYAVPNAKTYPFEGKKSPRYREQQLAVLKNANLPLFAPVVHIVRHPLKVISSTRRCFCGRGTRKNSLGRVSDTMSWKFVDQHIAMPRANLPYDSLLRSMTYWYEWNMLIRKTHATLISTTLRIEDLDPNRLAIGLNIDIPEGKVLPNRIPRSAHHISPDQERVERPDATWRELYEEDSALATRIFDLAKLFGYETESNTIHDLLK